LFSHGLTPLTQLLITESYRAEEIEEEIEQHDGKRRKTSYLTLRGLFRVVRSILLEFIQRQEAVDLSSHNWSQESQYGIVEGVRDRAYICMKNSEGKLLPLEAHSAQNWFEYILVIYQDNYIERLHESFSENQIDSDGFLRIATSGHMAGERIFPFDPKPSYHWPFLKQQALKLISQSTKTQKGYLQAIALLCAHLAMMNGVEEEWDSVLKAPTFGTPSFELERFIVDVIHDTTSSWSCKKAEEVFENHLKRIKILIPTRVEIACMLELAKLFQNEGLDEKRKKWLKAAYGDTALYPNLQNLIHNAMNSDDISVQAQQALNIL
jgi:hypothetical protein